MSKKLAKIKNGIVEGIYVYPDNFSSLDSDLVPVKSGAAKGSEYINGEFIPPQQPTRNYKDLLVDAAVKQHREDTLNTLINNALTISKEDFELMSISDLEAIVKK